MTEQIVAKLQDQNFNPDIYVTSLLRKSDSLDEFLTARQRLQQIAGDTSGSLKKNVYKNYQLFIDTAKEISYIESEMYQLNHMLSEQKSVLTAFKSMSLCGQQCDAGSATDENRKQPIASSLGADLGEQLLNSSTADQMNSTPKKSLTVLLEKVEGCANLLDMPGRYLMYNSDVLELDPNSFSPLRRMCLFLLSDCLMVASWLSYRRGPIRYMYESMYELDNLAVVNVRDTANVKHAFKLMMFPDSRVFCCGNANIKVEWLAKLDMAKKLKQQQANALKHKKGQSMYSNRTPFDDSPLTSESEDMSDSGRAADEEKSDTTSSNSYSVGNARSLTIRDPQWLIELPDDLDVCLAQRDFDQAVNLAHKAGDYIARHPCNRDLKSRIEHRIKQLTETLVSELKLIKGERSSRSTRRTVCHLSQLGKSYQAAQLLLEQRTTIHKQQSKLLRIEGVTSLDIRQMCNLFISQLNEGITEYKFCFAQKPALFPSLAIWIKSESHKLCSTFNRLVFTSQATLSNVADCIDIALTSFSKLSESGCDVVFMFESSIRPQVQRIILDTREKMLEAIKLRSNEEKWRPQNLHTKSGVAKLVEEFEELGIRNLSDYVGPSDGWFALNASTTHFAKAFICLVDDCLRLQKMTTSNAIRDTIAEVLRAELVHLSTAYDATEGNQHNQDYQFISKNSNFLMLQVVPLCEKKCKQICPQISDLKNEYSRLLAANNSQLESSNHTAKNHVTTIYL